jgi:hypothetical protein
MPNMATWFSRGPPVYDRSRKLSTDLWLPVRFRTPKVGCGHILNTLVRIAVLCCPLPSKGYVSP